VRMVLFTMKKIVMIKNNVVENLIKWDGVSHWVPGDEWTLVDVTEANYPIGVGYLYNPMLEPSFIQPQEEQPSE